MEAVGHEDDRAYMACGATNTYELQLRSGEPEFGHFAFSVCGHDALETLAERLSGAGAPVTDIDVSDEPGLEAGIETALPAGHVMRLVVERDPRPYAVSSDRMLAGYQGVGPVALEHITLLCPDIAATARFLTELLELRISDSVQPPSEPWRNTHLRAGVLHHDIGLLPGDQPALHHFCFAVPSVASVVKAADMLAARGISLDCSLGRHVAGNNVFLYFKGPGGHRLELNTDMARVDAAAPPKIVTKPLPFDAWRPGRPPSLADGTPARRLGADVSI
jgi:catechol 2,3-dioxygenase-like lactoylglutathione lyase family enzyme